MSDPPHHQSPQRRVVRRADEGHSLPSHVQPEHHQPVRYTQPEHHQPARYTQPEHHQPVRYAQPEHHQPSSYVRPTEHHPNTSYVRPTEHHPNTSYVRPTEHHPNTSYVRPTDHHQDTSYVRPTEHHQNKSYVRPSTHATSPSRHATSYIRQSTSGQSPYDRSAHSNYQPERIPQHTTTSRFDHHQPTTYDDHYSIPATTGHYQPTTYANDLVCCDDDHSYPAATNHYRPIPKGESYENGVHTVYPIMNNVDDHYTNDQQHILGAPTAGSLRLVIENATFRSDQDGRSKQDPFMQFKYDRHLKGKPQATKVATNAGLNPVWNQPFELTDIETEARDGCSLVLEAYDAADDAYDRDDKIGDTDPILYRDLIASTQTAPRTLRIYDTRNQEVGTVNVSTQYIKGKQGGLPPAQHQNQIQNDPRNANTRNNNLAPNNNASGEPAYVNLLIEDATFLKDQDTIGKQDPFIQFKYDRNPKAKPIKTKVHDNGGLKPVWNETKKLANIDREAASGGSLILEAWDKDTASNDQIGATKPIPYRDLTKSTQSNPMTLRVYDKKNKEVGTINVTAHYVQPVGGNSRGGLPQAQNDPRYDNVRDPHAQAVDQRDSHYADQRDPHYADQRDAYDQYPNDNNAHGYADQAHDGYVQPANTHDGYVQPADTHGQDNRYDDPRQQVNDPRNQIHDNRAPSNINDPRGGQIPDNRAQSNINDPRGGQIPDSRDNRAPSNINDPRGGQSQAAQQPRGQPAAAGGYIQLTIETANFLQDKGDALGKQDPLIAFKYGGTSKKPLTRKTKAHSNAGKNADFRNKNNVFLLTDYTLETHDLVLEALEEDTLSNALLGTAHPLRYSELSRSYGPQRQTLQLYGKAVKGKAPEVIGSVSIITEFIELRQGERPPSHDKNGNPAIVKGAAAKGAPPQGARAPSQGARAPSQGSGKTRGGQPAVGARGAPPQGQPIVQQR